MHLPYCDRIGMQCKRSGPMRRQTFTRTDFQTHRLSREGTLISWTAISSSPPIATLDLLPEAVPGVSSTRSIARRSTQALPIQIAATKTDGLQNAS